MLLCLSIQLVKQLKLDIAHQHAVAERHSTSSSSISDSDSGLQLYCIWVYNRSCLVFIHYKSLTYYLR